MLTAYFHLLDLRKECLQISKVKWYAVLVISSEESAEDDGDNPPVLHMKKPFHGDIVM